MTQLSFESCVTVHRQNQLAGGANDAPGALNEGSAKGLDLSKAPQGRAFRGRTSLARIEPHLKLASEVVSKNAGEHVQLVPNPPLDRHVAHLAVRLELGKDRRHRKVCTQNYGREASSLGSTLCGVAARASRHLAGRPLSRIP